MGAGGSTANSCSSLEAPHRRHLKHELRHRKRQQVPPPVPLRLHHNQKPMKHSNSYFDLGVGQHQLVVSSASPRREWTLEPMEAYAGYAPVLVLPASSPNHYVRPGLFKANKSNAGVASRIQQRQQQQQHQQQRLGKFSDSLPSLNLAANLEDVAHVRPQATNTNRYSSQHHLHQDQRPVSGPSKAIHSANKRQHLVIQDSYLSQMKRASSLHNLHDHCHQPLVAANNVGGGTKVANDLRQQPAVAKKVMKFRQATNSQNANTKYSKSRQQQRQQQQPVLPPLPRSQSLHELIQLRATENGQRMRTTGTLRGPLAGGQENSAGSAKVNLVVEMLENKRQERLKQQQQQLHQNDTMLSQPSSESTDDGIHDVSLSNHDQSTGDSSRLRPSSAQQHQQQPQRQRIYKRNSVDKKPAATQHQLKRSVSQSALVNEASTDADESDDLNELAKFLYQFKQRQQQQHHATQSKTSSAARGHQEADKSPDEHQHQHQSPNSSSSSGFASSSTTCSSASISPRLDEAQRERLKLAKSRKKYPAPPRPGDSSKRTMLSEPLVPSGKLKLSSSLLSIVDEYNSTLQSSLSSAKDELKPAPTCSNLTSVLLMGKRKHQQQVSNQPRQMGSQLEQLRRYTQLRQLSQSELALNQLGATPPPGQPEVVGGGNGVVAQQRPYKSKLINIIRRISTDRADLGELGAGRVCGSPGGLQRSLASPINQSASEMIGAGQPPANSNQFRPDESGADLEFDCDLALIKACSSLSAPQATAADASHLRMVEKGNWRLQPAAHSLDGGGGGGAGCIRNAKPVGQSISVEEKRGKWPAACRGWLMSGAGKQQQQQPCCLGKSISANSMAPASAQEQEEAKVNSEANQLLEELDQSLELVGAKRAGGSRAAGWWRMGDDLGGGGGGKLALHRLELRGGRVVLNGGYSGGSDTSDLNSSSPSDGLSSGQEEEDDDDDDDDVAYASFSRAMLQATFELPLPGRQSAKIEEAAKTTGATSSPSDSFTFAASSSLAPEVGQLLAGERQQTYSKCHRERREAAKASAGSWQLDSKPNGNHFAARRQMDFHADKCPVQGQSRPEDIFSASCTCRACHRQDPADNGVATAEAKATSGPDDRCQCRRRRPVANLHLGANGGGCGAAKVGQFCGGGRMKSQEVDRSDCVNCRRPARSLPKEDVKSANFVPTPTTTTTTRDNLISEPGRSARPKCLSKVAPIKSDADASTGHFESDHNCCHCRAPGELLRRNRQPTKRAPLGKFAPEPLCAGGNRPGALCRSSSELVGSQLANRSQQASPRPLLFGRLRGSLLNQTQEAKSQRPASGKPLLLGHRQLASSQLSLVPIGADLGDNFILKRKTPTAGLKLRLAS